MKTISSNMGYWSSLIMLVTFLIWIISFSGIAMTSPLFIWTNLENYIQFYQNNSQFFQNLAKASMLLFGPLFVIMLNALHDTTAVARKPFSRLGLMFGLVFAALSSLHYYVQLSAVRIALDKGLSNGLEHFVQANPLSVMTAVDMTGWTLFLGLSSLFMYRSVAKEQKWISIGFLVNGISCFMAMIGYLFQIDFLTFLFVNIGVGGAVILVSVSSLRYFRKQIQS